MIKVIESLWLYWNPLVLILYQNNPYEYLKNLTENFN